MPGWIKMPLGMEAGLGPGHFLLDGDLAPLPKKRAEPPASFLPMFIVAKRLETAGLIKMALGVEMGLGPFHIVVDCGPASLAKRGQRPQFLAHFDCGQTAGCIKMPLGMEVSLGPVLDGN